MRSRPWCAGVPVLLACSLATSVFAREQATGFILQSGRGLGVAMAFSPDGKTLATADDTGIALIDVATRRHRAFLPGVRGYVRTLAYSPDGRVLATGCEPLYGRGESALQIWDVDSQSEIRSLEFAPTVVGVAFTSSGESLVSAHEDASVRTWDWRRGELMSVTAHPTGEFIGGIALSPDGSKLAVVSGDAYRSWWESVEGKVYDATSETALGDFAPPNSNLQPDLRFSEDGRWILMDAQVASLEGAETHLERTSGSPWVSVLSVDASGVATVVQRIEDGRSLEQWDLTTGTKRRSVTFGSDWTTSVARSAELMAVRLARGSTPTVELYDRMDLSVVGDVTGPAVPPAGQTGGNGPLEIAEFTPDGRELVSVDAFGTIRFWDAKEWVETKRIETGCSIVAALRLGSRGDRLATECGVGGYVQLWNLDESREVARMGSYSAFEFTPDGTELAWVDRLGAVHIVEAATGKEIRSLSLGTAELRFTGDGRNIAGLLVESNAPMPGAMLRLAVWDAESGKERWHVVEGGSFAVSPDGRRIATTNRLYDVLTGEELLRYNRRRGFVQAIAFSADGRWLASGWESTGSSEDGTNIVIWDTRTWKEVAVLTGHEAPVGLVRFSPDARLLVSVSHDSTLRVWSLENVLR